MSNNLVRSIGKLWGVIYNLYMKKELVLRFYKRNQLQVLCALYIMSLFCGVALSMLLSDDPRWTGWSLSRLGEASVNRISAIFFNSGVFMAGLILMAIGATVRHNCLQIDQHSAAKIVTTLMVILMPICMFGVAFCPNDTMHGAHFVFSRGIVFGMVILMVLFPLSLQHINRRERVISFSFPIFATILAAQGYILKNSWFVIIEVILGFAAAAWLFVMCRHFDVQLRNHKLRVKK